MPALKPCGLVPAPWWTTMARSGALVSHVCVCVGAFVRVCVVRPGLWEQRRLMAGQPLAGGYRGAVWKLGDVEMFAVQMGLPSYNSNEPCWVCSSNRSSKHGPLLCVTTLSLWLSGLSLSWALVLGHFKLPGALLPRLDTGFS